MKKNGRPDEEPPGYNQWWVCDFLVDVFRKEKEKEGNADGSSGQ